MVSLPGGGGMTAPLSMCLSMCVHVASAQSELPVVLLSGHVKRQSVHRNAIEKTPVFENPALSVVKKVREMRDAGRVVLNCLEVSGGEVAVLPGLELPPGFRILLGNTALSIWMSQIPRRRVGRTDPSVQLCSSCLLWALGLPTGCCCSQVPKVRSCRRSR